MIEAVVFDLDGVLIDSEQVWDEVRRELAEEHGGRWSERAQREMMGMSSPEWSRYMHDVVGLRASPDEINAEVVRRMLARYSGGPPWLPGALEAVRRMAAAVPLGLASSSNVELIQAVLGAGGIAALFGATVSSEEVARGKPAPDVYLEAARRLAVPPERAAAIEDSEAGIRSARAAGMFVVAIPNPHFPPAGEALAQADAVLHSVSSLTPDILSA